MRENVVAGYQLLPHECREVTSRETDDLLIVGHLPQLGHLTALLLTGDADHGIISFRPGGLVGLERTETSWLATLILPPAGT